MDYEGEIFADNADIEGMLIQNQGVETLHLAMQTLLPQQKELLRKVYFEGCSIVSIAHEEGVTEGAIRDRLRKTYARLKKVL